MNEKENFMGEEEKKGIVTEFTENHPKITKAIKVTGMALGAVGTLAMGIAMGRKTVKPVTNYVYLPYEGDAEDYLDQEEEDLEEEEE